VIVVDLSIDLIQASPDVVSALVYSAQASDVRSTIIDGQVVMLDRRLLTLNERARDCATRIARRVSSLSARAFFRWRRATTAFFLSASRLMYWS
jgi:5-methylthioadenosine/S-adenosylhomocysteine deaminase